MDMTVRLSDFEMCTPGPFIKRQNGNWSYEYTAEGEKKYGRLAAKWFQRSDRNQKDRMTYAPGKSRVVGNALNRWLGLGSQPREGDAGRWNELLDYLFPDAPAARKYFEQWVAYPIQHPGAKLKNRGGVTQRGSRNWQEYPDRSRRPHLRHQCFRNWRGAVT